MNVRAASPDSSGGRWRRAASVVVVAAVLVGLPAPASAQFWRRFGVGVDVGRLEPTDSDVAGSVLVGFQGGVVPEAGWGLSTGLGWFRTDLREGAGSARRVGRLRVRPLMAGVGYTWVQGRLAMTTSLTGGISINDVALDPALLQEAPGGGQGYALEVDNSFAMRPGLRAQYFVARKLAITGSATYVFTRPRIVLSTPEESITGRWNASSFSLSGGVVFYPFR